MIHRSILGEWDCIAAGIGRQILLGSFAFGIDKAIADHSSW